MKKEREMEEIRTFIFRVERNRLKAKRKENVDALVEEMNMYKIKEEVFYDTYEYYYKMNTKNPLYQKLVKNVMEAPSRLDVFPMDIELSYTEEEMHNIVAYTPKRGYLENVEIREDSFYHPFEECEKCWSIGNPIKSWITPRTRGIKKLNKVPRMYELQWDLDILEFVSLPMYDYLRENGISDSNFLPVFTKNNDDALAYQLYWNDVLPKGAYQDDMWEQKQVCEECGMIKMVHKTRIYEYQNKFLDMNRVSQIHDVNRVCENYGGMPNIVISKRLHDLILKADPKASFWPVFRK